MSNGERRHQPNPSFISKGKDTAQRQQAIMNAVIEKGWVAFGRVPLEAVMVPLKVPGTLG
jgi:hypothetical protein